MANKGSPNCNPPSRMCCGSVFVDVCSKQNLNGMATPVRTSVSESTCGRFVVSCLGLARIAPTLPKISALARQVLQVSHVPLVIHRSKLNNSKSLSRPHYFTHLFFN